MTAFSKAVLAGRIWAGLRLSEFAYFETFGLCCVELPLSSPNAAVHDKGNSVLNGLSQYIWLFYSTEITV
jgi:hypothetical protein